MYYCVNDNLKRVISDEIKYLQAFNRFKKQIENSFDMPDSMIVILVSFLEQNNSKLSNRAKSKEFSLLSDQEVNDIEKIYKELFV